MTPPKKTTTAAKPKAPARASRARPSAKAPKPEAKSPSRAAPPAARAREAAPKGKSKTKGKRRRDLEGAHQPAVVAQIRELEAQLDRLIDEASRHDISSLDPDDLEDEPWAAPPTAHEVFDAEQTVPFARPATTRDEDDRDTNQLEHLGVAEDAGDAGAFGDTHPSATFPEPSRDAAAASFADADGRPHFEEGVAASPESVFDTARELLSTDFYLRKWGRLAMRGRSEEVDDFGFDPIYDAKFRPLLDFLYTRYFRVETAGIENVPATGRCLLVANHSGTLPLDGLMLKAALKREHSSPRDLRWLTEDFIYHLPFLGSLMNRLGAVRACQENAERLLGKEELVAVFPEGVKGIGKLFGERYRLQRFGRGGFIKLCLRTSTPIVPVAVLGAEETNPLLFKIEHLSKTLGVPYVPVTPTFPILGPLGLLPAPTKWRIQFGEPLDLGSHGPEAADDELLVGKLAERVRAGIQGMLDRAVGARKSVFFG